MYCRECGVAIQDDARFCHNCGIQVERPPGMVLPPQVVVPPSPPVPEYFPPPPPELPPKRHTGIIVIAVLLVLILLVGLIWGVAYLIAPKAGDTTEGAAGEQAGAGNSNNFGLMASDGQNIYYYDAETDSILCTLSDGTGQEMVYPGAAQYLNYSDGDLFLVARGGELIRLRQSASDAILMLAPAAEFVNVDGDYLYFANPNDNNYIYRVHRGGGEQNLVLDHSAYYLTTDGSHLYYQRDEDGESIYRCGMDGSNPQKLADGPMYYPFLVGGDVVYTDCDSAIYCVSPDGGQYVVVDATESQCLNAWNDWILYIDGNANLCRVHRSGSEPPEILASYVTGTPIHVLDGYVYYYSSDARSIMRIELQSLRNELFVGSGGASL